MTDEKKDDVKKEPTTLERANAAAERLEKANEKTEELVKRQEALHSENLLSGSAEAGVAPVPPKEETPEEYAAKAIAGDLNEE